MNKNLQQLFVKTLTKLKKDNIANKYATQCGNKVISLLERKPALDLYFGKDIEKNNDGNKRLAYGSGSGSSIQGYKPIQQVYYEYSKNISKIGKTIMKELKRAKRNGKKKTKKNITKRELRIAKSISALDLKKKFNTMHIKIYFNGKATAWHNDNVHCNKDGKFKEEQNSVVPNTPAVICTELEIPEPSNMFFAKIPRRASIGRSCGSIKRLLLI